MLPKFFGKQLGIHIWESPWSISLDVVLWKDMKIWLMEDLILNSEGIATQEDVFDNSQGGKLKSLLNFFFAPFTNV